MDLFGLQDPIQLKIVGICILYLRFAYFVIKTSGEKRSDFAMDVSYLK